jgi:DNA-binding MarR family transcriptional regulator
VYIGAIENPYAQAAEFRATLRRFLRRSEDCARENGITPRQYHLLLQIAGSRDGRSTVSRLVERLSLAQSAVTELVQRAEAAGLVARTQSASDARVMYLSLTPEGATKLSTVHGILGPERAELRAVLESLAGEQGGRAASA